MRRIFVILILGMSLSLLPATPREPAWSDLPSELSAVLEAKAAGYSRRALGFTCLERRRQARYSNNVAASEKVTEYDYLLERDPDDPLGYRAVRLRPGSKSTKERNVDGVIPEPFFWSQIFDPAIRSTLRFRVGQWHTTPWKLAIPVEWTSSSPVFEGRRIGEWSGRIDVEYRTGNLVRVIAWPSLQEERIRAEFERYLTAFRFLGIGLAPPPIGLEVEVQFDYEHEGFSYPTRVEVRRFRQVGHGEDDRVTVSKQVIEYDHYKFFGTSVKDEIPPLLYNAPHDADALTRDAATSQPESGS